MRCEVKRVLSIITICLMLLVFGNQKASNAKSNFDVSDKSNSTNVVDEKEQLLEILKLSSEEIRGQLPTLKNTTTLEFSLWDSLMDLQVQIREEEATEYLNKYFENQPEILKKIAQLPVGTRTRLVHQIDIYACYNRLGIDISSTHFDYLKDYDSEKRIAELKYYLEEKSTEEIIKRYGSKTGRINNIDIYGGRKICYTKEESNEYFGKICDLYLNLYFEDNLELLNKVKSLPTGVKNYIVITLNS